MGLQRVSQSQQHRCQGPPDNNINICRLQVNWGDRSSLILPRQKQFVHHNCVCAQVRHKVGQSRKLGKKSRKRWEEGKKKGGIKGNREGEIEILIVSLFFLQACNMIKGIFDLVLTLPCGCYLVLQHDERTPFCWWNGTLFLEILVQKQHFLLYSSVLQQGQDQQQQNSFITPGIKICFARRIDILLKEKDYMHMIVPCYNDL